MLLITLSSRQGYPGEVKQSDLEKVDMISYSLKLRERKFMKIIGENFDAASDGYKINHLMSVIVFRRVDYHRWR